VALVRVRKGPPKPVTWMSRRVALRTLARLIARRQFPETSEIESRRAVGPGKEMGVQQGLHVDFDVGESDPARLGQPGQAGDRFFVWMPLVSRSMTRNVLARQSRFLPLMSSMNRRVRPALDEMLLARW